VYPELKKMILKRNWVRGQSWGNTQIGIYVLWHNVFCPHGPPRQNHRNGVLPLSPTGLNPSLFPRSSNIQGKDSRPSTKWKPQMPCWYSLLHQPAMDVVQISMLSLHQVYSHHCSHSQIPSWPHRHAPSSSKSLHLLHSTPWSPPFCIR